MDAGSYVSVISKRDILAFGTPQISQLLDVYPINES
jgi:hypothetical protein